MPREVSLAQLYLDIADNLIVTLDTRGTITEINQKGSEILGYPKADIVGRKFEDFLPERTRDEVRRVFRNWLAGALHLEHYENKVVTRDGREKIIEWHSLLLQDSQGHVVGGLCSGEDITELRRTETLLKESEGRLHSTLDSMLEGCQIIDHNWRYAYVNDAVAKQGRRTKEELLGQTMMAMYPGIENTAVFVRLRDCMENRVPQEMENEFTFPDGSKGWFELRIEPVPEGILVLSLEITERKRLEEEINKYRQRLEEVVARRTAELVQVNERLTRTIAEHQKAQSGLALRSAILDSARQAIFLINPKGDFIYTNEAASDTYGYGHDEFLNMKIHKLVPPRDAPDIESRLKEVIKQGRLELETVHLRKDGTSMPVEVRYSLVKLPHGQLIVSVIRDITRELELRTSLEQASRRGQNTKAA